MVKQIWKSVVFAPWVSNYSALSNPLKEYKTFFWDLPRNDTFAFLPLKLRFVVTQIVRWRNVAFIIIRLSITSEVKSSGINHTISCRPIFLWEIRGEFTSFDSYHGATARWFYNCGQKFSKNWTFASTLLFYIWRIQTFPIYQNFTSSTENLITTLLARASVSLLMNTPSELKILS